MPLAAGYSKETIRKNIEKEIRAGKSSSQASAIAYDRAREWWEVYHGNERKPKWLR